MKKCLLAAAAALGVISSASAADLGARGYNNAPAYAAPIYAWTGFYLGAHVGGAFSTAAATISTAWCSPTTTRVCSAACRPAPTGSSPAISWSARKASTAGLGKNNLSAVFPTGFVYSNNQRALASVTARFGYAFGAALFYVKGGYAWSDNNETLTFGGAPVAFALDSSHSNGWTAGGGVEYHVRAKLVGQGRIPIL